MQGCRHSVVHPGRPVTAASDWMPLNLSAVQIKELEEDLVRERDANAQLRADVQGAQSSLRRAEADLRAAQQHKQHQQKQAAGGSPAQVCLRQAQGGGGWWERRPFLTWLRSSVLQLDSSLCLSTQLTCRLRLSVRGFRIHSLLTSL